MQLGVTFPQTEIGADPGAIRDYAQAAEGLGFDYLLAYDHVIGAQLSARPDWAPMPGRPPPYTHESMFHEPFALFGFLAGVTQRLGLATGVLILGQRQTALVAKQASEVDVLSGGRLRLGIGTGWNDVEYEALGMNFHDRGARSEEQIALLKAMWTQEVVTFNGRWNTVTAAGINPLPVQRPIPIWFGGGADTVLRRAARIGDGFFLLLAPDERGQRVAERIRSYVKEAGRDPAAFGIETGVSLGEGTVEQAVETAIAWRALGATHVTFNSMNAGLKTPNDHIDAITRYKGALGPMA